MIALSAGNAFGGVVFSDSTFNLANYLTTAPFESPAGTTIVVSQCASCGDPGSALQVTATFPVDGNAAIGIVNQTFAYDPGTQGPILSISASVDKLLMDQADQTSSSSTFTNTFRPLIEQDGFFYLAAIPGPGSTTLPFNTGYVALSRSGLLATDFVQFDFSTDSFGTAHPNFSGDPMLFGIGQISGQSGFTNLVGTAQYDNLRIAVVPEPATLALLGVGLAGIGFSRRRKLN